MTLREEGRKAGRERGDKEPEFLRKGRTEAWQAKTSLKPLSPRLGGKRNGNKGHTQVSQGGEKKVGFNLQKVPPEANSVTEHGGGERD